MEVAEIVSMPMQASEMPVAPPCTPSPQPGDRTYSKEEEEMCNLQAGGLCDGVTMLAGMTPGKGAPQPQLQPTAYPQTTYTYAPYYQYTTMPQSGTPYGPTVMYTVPMPYYPNVRQTAGHQTYHQMDAYTSMQQQAQQQAQQVVQQHPQQQQAQQQQHAQGGKPHVEPPTIVKTPSRQRVVIWNYCQFCQNNREPEEFYRGHILRDADGNVVCPILRAYNCPICNNGGGNKAHTKSYCPQLRASRMPRRSALF